MKSPKFTIEAYGLKGMKRVSWTKKFKNEDALSKWLDENDAEMFAMRVLSASEQS